jgi:hypothetical protein
MKMRHRLAAAVTLTTIAALTPALVLSAPASAARLYNIRLRVRTRRGLWATHMREWS